MINIDAVVVSGRGIASQACAQDIEQINRDHGLSLINGSLNLVSMKPYWLDTKSAFFQSDSHVYWNAWIKGVPVALGRWFEDCPVHVFEIFAGDLLRTKFNLKDGDVVTISLPHSTFSSNRGLSIWDRLEWYALWRGREKQFYNMNERYLGFVRQAFFRRYLWRSIQQR